MKYINNVVIILSLVVSLFSKNILFTVLLIPLLGISFLIRKYNKNLEFVYLLFIFIAYILGYVYDYYDSVYYFDAIAHSYFGIFASIYSLPLLKLFKKYNSKNKIFNIFFIITVTLSIAAFWEIIEFTIDRMVASADMQRGLNNTMKDIISAFLFSIMYSLIYFEKQPLIEKIFITKN